MANREANDTEKDELARIGDAIYDHIPMEEKLRHNGERIAIDIRTREIRYFDASIPAIELPVTGAVWTSIIRLKVEHASLH